MSKRPLRIAFMGTPDFAVTALQQLLNENFNIVCVYSQPPRPKGRGQKLQASPVHQLAESAEVEVRHPINFKNKHDVKDFQNLNLDLAIVAAYGLILPKEILKAPKYGCINIHASILPRWRGAAPIHRAILAGDSETGVTLMKMDEGLDTGDMIAIERTAVTGNTTLPDLHDQLAQMGGDMIVKYLNAFDSAQGVIGEKQPDEGVTYAKMLTKEEGRIDWTQSAEQIERQIRALNPWPGTWTMNQNRKRVKILSAKISDQQFDKNPGDVLSGGFVQCGERSVLELLKIQPENKKPMDIDVAVNGNHLNEGDILQ